MHKVCDIRNPNLRAGLAPRALWVAYADDLNRLMDRSGVGDPAHARSLASEVEARPVRKAA